MENISAIFTLHPENVEPLTIKEVALICKRSPATIKNWHYGHSIAPHGFPSPIQNGGMLNWRNCDIYFFYKNAKFAPSAISCNGPISENQDALDSKPKRKRGRPRKIIVAGGGAK